MRLPRDKRRSGLSLMLAGLATVLYFWLTDPSWGIHGKSSPDIVDAIIQASPGTVIGIVIAATVALIGGWLTLRGGT
jgi:hypothetical protein